MKLNVILTIEADGFRSVCVHGSFDDAEADPFRFTAYAGNGLQIDTEGYGYLLLDLGHLTDLALVQEMIEEAETHHEDGLLTEEWILDWLRSRDVDAESFTLQVLTAEAA